MKKFIKDKLKFNSDINKNTCTGDIIYAKCDICKDAITGTVTNSFLNKFNHNIYKRCYLFTSIKNDECEYHVHRYYAYLVITKKFGHLPLLSS